MRIFARHWGESGIRTWRPGRFFYFSAVKENYQGDIMYSVTLHLLGRAYQATYWR